MKKRIVLLLQAIVSLSLLVFIFRKEEFRTQAWHLLVTADPWWLLAGLVTAGVMNLLGVLRWGIFLRVMEIDLPPWEILRLSWIGLFFNNFLVGAAGGDAVKVVWLCAKGYGRYPSLISVLLDRLSGIGPLLLCTFGFILARYQWLSRSPTVAELIHFVFLYLGGLTVLLLISFFVAFRTVPAWVPGRERLTQFTRAYSKFITSWRETLAGSIVSLVMLILSYFIFYFSARAFGLRLPLFDFFSLMPLVETITALPVSLGGFGVREGMFVTLLRDLCGVAEAQAVSVSLGGAFLSLVWGLAGLALLPSYRKVADRSETEA